jgi:hypothetical protein
MVMAKLSLSVKQRKPTVIEGEEIRIQLFLASALDSRERLASRPVRSNFEARAIDTDWIGAG